MANGTVNKVYLVGRLGADPQLRYTPSGKAAVSFNLATNASWRNQEGEKQERTDWHRITAWGKLAEVIGEWLRKGSLVHIEGSLQTRKYEKDGEDRYITEVVARDMEMLGGKQESSGNAAPEESGPEAEDDLPF